MRKTKQKIHGTKKGKTQTKKTNILDKESSKKTLTKKLPVRLLHPTDSSYSFL